MIKNILNIFSKKKYINKRSERELTTIVDKIRYQNNLIPEFVSDHTELLDIIHRIQICQSNRDWISIDNYLKELKIKIYAHLLKENGHLYTYLQCTLERETDEFIMMRELQKEMRGISKALSDFLSKYEKLKNDKILQASFSKDFSNICGVLAIRIECEEKTLYPLYIQR